MDYNIVGMILTIIAIVIAVAVHVHEKEAAWKKENKETDWGKESKEGLDNSPRTLIYNTLKNIQNFKISDSYITENDSAFIAVDEKNRKIIVGEIEKFTGRVIYDIVEAKLILGVEVTENGKGLLSTSANTNTLGMAAVGGLLFGGAGAIVGAISGSNTKSIIKEISLRIAKDDIKKPYVGINFLPSVVSKGSDENTYFLKIAEKWYGILNILLNREKKATQTKVEI